MRKAKKFFFFIIFQAAVLLFFFVHSHYQIKGDHPSIQQKKLLVRDLDLTDLCLFTEASYTRHLTQADRHTPFQDSPMALEHFPSGSIVSPPGGLKR
jgi:predicted membrane channel-forming protein YqfA (hemolysin III family)